jgi:alpha-beta hydrolase superfamily lysophospholipase
MSGKPLTAYRWFFAAMICVLAGTTSSCKLDSLLFNTKQLSSYAVSTRIIPDSVREFVSLRSMGNAIYGFYVRSSGANSDKTILYCHGNRESIEAYWDRVELLYQGGYNVFIFDYQGFGMSGGEASEEALYADGRAALAYVTSRPDVSPRNLLYYGYSLGAVVAINLAAGSTQPSVLVCESPFASGEAVLQSGTLIDIPGQIALKGKFDNAATIRQVRAPFLLFHGTDDRFVDIEKNGQVVFDNANEPKKFIRVSGAGHTTVPYVLGVETYLQDIADFVLAHKPTPEAP